MEVWKQTKVSVPLSNGNLVELTVIAALKTQAGLMGDYISAEIIKSGRFYEEHVVHDIAEH